MLKIKKITIDRLNLDKKKIKKEIDLMHMSPPCDPEVGNCNPSATCDPAKS